MDPNWREPEHLAKAAMHSDSNLRPGPLIGGPLVTLQGGRPITVEEDNQKFTWQVSGNILINMMDSSSARLCAAASVRIRSHICGSNGTAKASTFKFIPHSATL